MPPLRQMQSRSSPAMGDSRVKLRRWNPRVEPRRHDKDISIAKQTPLSFPNNGTHEVDLVTESKFIREFFKSTFVLARRHR